MNVPNPHHVPNLNYYELKCILCNHVFNGYYSDKDLKIQSACTTCAYTLSIFDAHLHGKLFDKTLNLFSDYSDKEYVARREMMEIVSYLINDEISFLNKLKKWAKES